MSSDDQRNEAFERHRREQLLRAKAMTPAERFAWLERTHAELSQWVGLARQTKTRE